MIQGQFDNSPVRYIQAKVEVFNASTGAKLGEYKSSDKLISIDIERVSEEGKFFGFGICQKTNIHLIDVERQIQLNTDCFFKIYFNNVCNFPNFYISEVRRDENTNELSITAYDALYKATAHTVEELVLPLPYTVLMFADAVAKALKVEKVQQVNVEGNSFSLSYPNGANFEGKETFRDALNDVAEVTQTMYFLNNTNNLVFKRMNEKSSPITLLIGRDKYFQLDTKTNRRLTGICYTNELGNNIEAKLPESGTTQYINDNAFIEMREDIPTIVDDALAAMGKTTINQFNCEWRGNYLLELGDKIVFMTKDNEPAFTFLLDDTIKYNGSMAETSKWQFTEQEKAEHTNPSNLGEAIKETFARVDKVNKEIDIVASENEKNKSELAQIKVQTNSIQNSVISLEKTVDEGTQELKEVRKEVNTKLSDTELKIEVLDSEVKKGEAKSVVVENKQGFRFDKDGLTISESGNPLETTISENGMKVLDNGEDVLVANNNGVDAKNLHATTYLIVGKNSRFEDFGEQTGCFWIGGNS